MSEMLRLAWFVRRWNGARKLLAGLTPGGENLWPGVQNDLFLAHLSIYCFAASFTQGKRVLDAGSGAGYGSAKLADSGAAEVLGVDLDVRNIRYARRKYKRPNLRFAAGDCENLEFAAASFDFVVSSNVLEHLRQPERFLASAEKILAPKGRMLLAIPCITNERLLAYNLANPHHRSNLMVDQWLRLFQRYGWQADIFRHYYPNLVEDLDFSSPFSSSAILEAFEFIPSDRDDMYSRLSLTGVYLLSRATTLQSLVVPGT